MASTFEECNHSGQTGPHHTTPLDPRGQRRIVIPLALRAPAGDTTVRHSQDRDLSHIDLLHDPGCSTARLQVVATGRAEIKQRHVRWLGELLGR